jgi:predicted aldo/keto reductase-like oxidoreductase
MQTPLLTEAETAAVFDAAKKLSEMPKIPCTGCEYCVKGCPMNINIPDVFESYNIKTVYNNLDGARRSYGFALRNHGNPSDCIGCGKCESACPQKISIINQLKIAKNELEN